MFWKRGRVNSIRFVALFKRKIDNNLARFIVKFILPVYLRDFYPF